jgi:hypothetical protein
VKILVLAPKPMSDRLSGPNIRAIGIARELARRFETTLGLLNESALLRSERFATRVWDRRSVGRVLGEYDAVVSQGTQYPAGACLRRNGRPCQVFDLHNPLLFELFAGTRDRGAPFRHMVNYLTRLNRFLLKRADFILCASPRQRDLWLGALYTLPDAVIRSLHSDRHLMESVAVVPFGHDGDPPRPSGKNIRAALPGLGATDRILLWNGGVWNWFDPLTLIRAVARIAESRPNVKLLFMGTRHPDEAQPCYETLARARTLAAELGVLDRWVFFNDGWIPYEERADYLLQSDLAICTSPESLENDFSFRTRLIDAVWAGLPILCTRSGFMADFVDRHDIGLTTPGSDVEALAAAIGRALDPEAQARFRRNLQACRDELRWDRCVTPLVEFCAKVERGDYLHPKESLWRPRAQYWQYKLPTMLETLGGLTLLPRR